LCFFRDTGLFGYHCNSCVIQKLVIYLLGGVTMRLNHTHLSFWITISVLTVLLLWVSSTVAQQVASTQSSGYARENLENARAAQKAQVEYRADKRWKIFSWVSSLLIGSIAGAAVARKRPLGRQARALTTGAVFVLALHAVIWLNYNGRTLSAARTNLERVDERLGTYDQVQLCPIPYKLGVGYEITVAVLALLAIALIYIPALDGTEESKGKPSENVT
jgi:hypothetical protein